MKTNELRAERAKIVTEAKSLREKAKAGNRDLTDEEFASVQKAVDASDALKSQIETAEARAKVLESLDTDAESLSQPLTRKAGPEAAITESLIKVAAKAPAIARGRAKNFKTVEAAYRFGMWIMAACGSDKARRFCAENGYALAAATQTETNNSLGGYLVPEEFESALIDLRETYGIFRMNAKLVPMLRDTKSIPRRATGLTAYWTGEGAAITASNKTLGNVTLTAKKLAAVATMTNELREDAIINIADDLAKEIAYAFSQSEDEAGFNGDGGSTYGGIVGVRAALKNLSGTIANIAGLVVAAGNNYSEITLANFNSVVGRLPQFADTPSAKWYMHKSFFHEVADRLAYAAGGTTVAEIGAKTSRMFLGYPVQFAQVLPKAEANDQVCALFGDLTLAAAFGDRRETSIAFSEHATIGSDNMFEKDQIAVRGTERLDINVHDVGNASSVAADRVPGPVVGLIMAAS